jgi:hypothetical protein
MRIVSRRMGERHATQFAHRLMNAGLLLALISSALRAQAAAIPGGSNAAQIIANAEAEGATFRHLPSPSVVPALFASPLKDLRAFEEMVGRNAIPANKNYEDRTCTVGQGLGPVRSGEFVIGGQLSGKEAMIAGQPGKVWWAPLHHGRNMPPLVVRGRNLSAPSDTVRFTSAMVAASAAQSHREYFFPSGIIMPRPGRWLVIATSGANWGCFILGVT